VVWSAGQSSVAVSVDLPINAQANSGAAANENVGGRLGAAAGLWVVDAQLTADAASADVLREDNQRFAVVEVRQRLRVGVVDEAALDAGLGAGAFVRAALSPELTGDRFAVAAEALTASTMDEKMLKELDAVVILRPDVLGAARWSVLAGFAAAGGLVWVFPTAGGEAAANTSENDEWFGLMRSAMGVGWTLGENKNAGDAAAGHSSEMKGGPRRLETDTRPPSALLLLSADWPALLGPVQVHRGLRLSVDLADEAWISLAGADDSLAGVFLASSPKGDGRLLLCASALDPAWTNLPTKPVFPALLHDALRGVLGEAQRGAGRVATVGDQPTLGRRWVGASSLSLIGGEASVALTQGPAGGLRLLERLSQPGVYAASAGATAQRLAVNVPADSADVRGVSEPQWASWWDAVGTWQKLDEQNPAAVLAEAQRQMNLGWWLLWMLLGLVLFEIVLARWFSHAAHPQRASAETTTPQQRDKTAKKKPSSRTAAAWWWAVMGLVGTASSAPQTASAQAWVDGWLGLEQVSWSEATALGWRYALPAWVWVLIGVGAVASAWWGYRKLAGPTWGRVVCAGLRGLLIGLIAVLLAGPEVVRSDETVEQDVLLILVDRSASMNVADMPPGSFNADPGSFNTSPGNLDPSLKKNESLGPLDFDGAVLEKNLNNDLQDASESGTKASGGGLISREAALRWALESQGEVFGPEQLGRDRQVMWLGFGEKVFELASPMGENGVAVLGEAQDQATSLRTAIEEALRRVAGRPISGIVLISDGQSPQATGASLLTKLEQQSTRVFSVPLGAERLPLDLVLTRVDPPKTAFINDPVPVTVVVEQPGVNADQQIDPANVTVRLIDTQTQDVVDEKTLKGVGLGRPLRLKGQSSQTGELSWTVEVLYNPPPESPPKSSPELLPELLPESSSESLQTPSLKPVVTSSEKELNLTNNTESFTVEMIDRPIRVLYIEGYPRWEYRYLKNMLIREKSIDSSILLLSADRSFAQEGDTPITRLPREAEEWQRYDVVILGDVPADVMTPQQRKALHDLVSRRGAGLLWIGGPGSTPRSYAATMLSDLLPMRDPEAAAVLPFASLSVQPTALAKSLSVLQLQADESAEPNGGDFTWPAELPPLRWVQDLGKLKASAEVLARVQPRLSHGLNHEAAGEEESNREGDNFGNGSSHAGELGEPLIARMRFGAGQSVYVATDETWRWRYARGEVYFERFWVQLVRMLGRSAATRSDERVSLTASARRTPRGGTVVLDLVIQDAALLSRNLSSIRVAVRKISRSETETSNDAATLAEFELRPQRDENGFDAGSGGVSGGTSGAASGGGAERVYTGAWLARVSGALELVVIEPALAGFELTAKLEVIAPDDELRRAEADVARLVRLAEATGGRVVAINDLSQLTEPGVVRNLSRKTINDVAEPIWNSGLALGLLIGLIALEWIVRKLIRLV